MDKCHQLLLPFEVGQVVEARSFQRGYRGAWFKCKIKEISRRNRQLHYALEYVDFPDEKVKWTKVYQLPQTHNGKSKEVKKELMVRPSYPPMYHENKAPRTISEVVIFVNDLWKVGDLMDCWFDGCYWSAKVTKILGGKKAEVDLMPIPKGEGLSYTVHLNDVRPSLDWSPEHGWTLPVSQDGERNRCYGHLILPEDGAPKLRPGVKSFAVSDSSTVKYNDGELSKKSADCEFLIANANRETLDSSSKLNYSVKETSIAKEVIGARETKICLVEENKDKGKRKRSCSNSSNVTKAVSDEEQPASGGGKLVPALSVLPENINLIEGIRFSQKMFIPCEESSLDMDQEAAVLLLEDLRCKVKWLKRILKSGSSFCTADAVKPNWKIIENHATSSSN